MSELTTLRSVTTDPHEADMLLRAANGRFAFAQEPGREFAFRVHQEGDADLQVGRYSIGGDWISEGEFEQFCIAAVMDGEYEWDIDGERDFAFRAPFLLQPGNTLYCHAQNVRMVNLYLSMERLSDVARTTSGDDSLVPSFDSPRAISAAHARYLLSAAKVASEFVSSGTIANELVRASLFHRLAVAAVECFRLTGEREERPSSPADVRRRFRRGLHFIEDNASLPITPGDIAQAAGASLRQLDAAFREHAGMSASACLRRVRLGAARDDLRSGRIDGVTSAAARWGFTDPERFVRAYRIEFGDDDVVGRPNAEV